MLIPWVFSLSYTSGRAYGYGCGVCSSETALKQPCEPKSLNISGVEKNALGKLAVVANTGGHLTRVLNERSVSDDGNLCLQLLVILKSV